MTLTLDQIVVLYDHLVTGPYMRRFLLRQGIIPPSNGLMIRSLDADTTGWLHDAAVEALLNEAPIVESFDAEMDKGVFPIHIQGIEGVYIVRAQEFDDSEAIPTIEEARRHVNWEFGEFLVDSDEHDDDHGAGGGEDDECPYCGRNDACEHFLLLLDLTFRDVQGGPLYDDFRARWWAVQEQGEEDASFDEGDAFQQCIDEVDQVAGSGAEFDFEGGPGQSSRCQIWYLPSKEQLALAVKAYRRVVGGKPACSSI